MIDNLLVRIHFIIEIIWWTGLAPWEFESPFPGSLICPMPPEKVTPISCDADIPRGGPRHIDFQVPLEPFVHTTKIE